MTPHLNGLIEMGQMRGHNICFYAELTKIITKYSHFSRALLIVYCVFIVCLYTVILLFDVDIHNFQPNETGVNIGLLLTSINNC